MASYSSLAGDVHCLLASNLEVVRNLEAVQIHQHDLAAQLAAAEERDPAKVYSEQEGDTAGHLQGRACCLPT